MSDIVVSAPGKIIFLGEHAVVYGKAALAFTIDLRTKVKVDLKLDESKLKITLPSLDAEWKLEELSQISYLQIDEENEIIPLSNEEYLKCLQDLITLSNQESSNQTLLVFLYLYLSIFKIYKRPFQPLLVTITSQLPIGAGLGSSASYSVCLSAAFLAACGKISPAPKLSNDNLALISKWAFQAEKIIHGQPSGIDNSVCTYGGALLFKKGHIYEKLSFIPSIKIMLINTKVSRNTKWLVTEVRKKFQKHEDILNYVMSAIDSISESTWKILKKNTGEEGSEELLTRLQEYITMNHHLLNVLGVGHKQLDEIVDLAKQQNLAAKLTGAGGGGCAFILLSVENGLPTENLTKPLINVIGDAFESKEGHHHLHQILKEKGFESWDAIIGCPGVMFH